MPAIAQSASGRVSSAGRLAPAAASVSVYRSSGCPLMYKPSASFSNASASASDQARADGSDASSLSAEASSSPPNSSDCPCSRSRWWRLP
jgi:hypothetical protein